MGEIQEITVNILSTETIKPSSPTPSHLNNYKLSYLNQILPLVPIFPTCGLVFYPPSPKTKPLGISHLKTCLSQTLTKFYPLAGKVGNLSVHCNDDGIPFLEAQTNCSVLEILDSNRNLDVMAKFLPPTESLGMGTQPITELTHIAIQVTVFACGGVSIGWYDIHKVLDGISAATFFKYWAALSSQCPDTDVVQPDLDACVGNFPPTNKSLELPVVNVYKEQVKRSPTVAKSFIFKTAAIIELKAKAVSEHVPKPTSFQAIAGFLWEQALNASKTSDNNNNTGSVLHLTLDIRPRVNPPLPNGSVGNLAVITVARAENGSKMPELVADINSAVSEMKEEMKEYQRENGVETLIANWSNVINSLVEYKDRAYRLISWSRLGFSDLDFGFGKPLQMVPTDGKMSPFHRNMIILNDYRDSNGDGIEAWLFLEEKEMMALESCQEFLAFAAPRNDISVTTT